MRTAEIVRQGRCTSVEIALRRCFAQRVEFLVLGPVEARLDGRVLQLGGPKQRVLLALLLLNANEVVSRDRLVDSLWGERAPDSAQRSLDTYVSRLRTLLGAHRIERRSPGYVLRVQPGELDLERFEALLEQGRAAAAARDPETADGRLREALGLWRGPALSDLATESALGLEAERLEERRLLALAGRIDAELALGGGPELLGELERLVDEHPFQERLLGQLMLSLYRAGRPAEALAAYQAFRQRLAGELGLEPSVELRTLERRILEQDGSLGPAAAAPAVGSSRRATRTWILAGAAALAAVAASSFAGIELGTHGSRALPTTSSLDGQTVLPERSRWLVHPDVPDSAVREVDYIIDGKLRWVDPIPPYYYGGDDNGADPGYLVTTWLSPGEHVFESHVVSADGTVVATDVVTARVPSARALPAAIAGTWTRTVSKHDIAKSSPAFGVAVGNVPPAGVWRLVFDRIGAWELDPRKTGLVTEYQVVADVLFAYAPISIRPWPCTDNGPCGVTRAGHNFHGRECSAAGPFGSYHWSVSGGRLTLTAIQDPCGQRRAVWEGTWTRSNHPVATRWAPP
jgi:DNA-binding SARP family transcriptional activator